MLKLAVLGLLQREPLNGYRLKQQLEMFMSCSICVNYGGIYPLLKRMEEQGEVMLCAEQVQEDGQCGKIYQITPHGKTTWYQEMLAYPHESWVNARSRFLIKFFFFGYLLPEERVQLIEHRLMSCRLRLVDKKALEVTDDLYQAKLQKRVIEVIQSEIGWLVEQLQTEQLQLAKMSTSAKQL
ncbi:MULTISPECIES: PadR family transcriptional regulator [unclassified Nostoc]|uniref:PadR family transcriptional regulator n=1 Tax=unclassified Nostoc TaxID=2593658 RepID=UPI0025D2CEB7|nr:PadR family transcriptional regulator [Nostoc sp. JL33]MBN3873025.1 PadR family transcriptional regulator [Nostoc sp. JL33]